MDCLRLPWMMIPPQYLPASSFSCPETKKKINEHLNQHDFTNFTNMFLVGNKLVGRSEKQNLPLDIKWDEPFDIQGGLGFFLVTRYIFSLFAQQVIFFKRHIIILKNNILKSDKNKRKQHTE